MKMTHHPNCSADYPEKPTNEAPRLITREQFDGYWIDTCVDCGATDTNLPPDDDPYWDDVRN